MPMPVRRMGLCWTDGRIDLDATSALSLAADATTHEGVLVALWLTPEAADALAVEGGEDADSLHLTLCYCDGDIADALPVVADFAKSWTPLSGNTDGVSSFEPSDSSDGMVPIYAVPVVDGIHPFREYLAEALTEAGVVPHDDHGDWVPHITLKYADLADDPSVDLVPAVPLDFVSIRVVQGDEVHEFPLTGGDLDLREYVRDDIGRFAETEGGGAGRLGGAAAKSYGPYAVPAAITTRIPLLHPVSDPLRHALAAQGTNPVTLKIQVAAKLNARLATNPAFRDLARVPMLSNRALAYAFAMDDPDLKRDLLSIFPPDLAPGTGWGSIEQIGGVVDRRSYDSYMATLGRTTEGDGGMTPANQHRAALGDAAVEAATQRYMAAALVRQWANSSGDHDPVSIAIQQAAQDEFGLSDAAVDHFGARDRENSQLATQAGAAGLRAFVRAQYDETQAFLAQHGVTEVTLYRGVVGQDSAAKDWLQRHLSDFMYRPKMVPIHTQAVSSFSLSVDTARNFTNTQGMVVAMRVPAKQILSTFATGVGSSSEKEVTVLGGHYLAIGSRPMMFNKPSPMDPNGQSARWVKDETFSDYSALLHRNRHLRAIADESPIDEILMVDELTNGDWIKHAPPTVTHLRDAEHERPPVLTPAAIRAVMAQLPEWQVHPEGLVRSWVFDNRRIAAAVVAEVLAYSNTVNHHPDVQIDKEAVTITWRTRASNGITQLDVDGAVATDAASLRPETLALSVGRDYERNTCGQFGTDDATCPVGQATVTLPAWTARASDATGTSLGSHEPDVDHAAAVNERLIRREHDLVPQDLENPDTVYREAEALKAHVGDQVTAAMDRLDHDTMDGSIRYLRMSSESTSAAVARRVVANWAITSGDLDSPAIRMQDAARQTFGLTDATMAPEWDEILANETSQRKRAQGSQSDGEAFGRAARVVLKDMYERTQQTLAALKIHDVTVYRGMGLRASEAAKLPTGAAVVTMRPMSSFTTDYKTAAEGFADTGMTYQSVIAMRVPASRILSTPLTGFGCKVEREIVVLGGAYEARVVTTKDGLPWTADRFMDAATAVPTHLREYVRDAIGQFAETPDATATDPSDQMPRPDEAVRNDTLLQERELDAAPEKGPVDAGLKKRVATQVGRDASDGRLGELRMHTVTIDAPIAEIFHLAKAWTADFGIAGKGMTLRFRQKIAAMAAGHFWLKEIADGTI